MGSEKGIEADSVVCLLSSCNNNNNNNNNNNDNNNNNNNKNNNNDNNNNNKFIAYIAQTSLRAYDQMHITSKIINNKLIYRFSQG